eukprot:TRINITY_DN60759_c0_g1_i1.p1 TRINITY_DN60759_c0_g1~~TRINITY_DN60759_c0_g1_i1.p1  ORF type:complete len:193 (-),score=53.13 TRINITY_DN60759_c0_g1_i1:547-1125(-)
MRRRRVKSRTKLTLLELDKEVVEKLFLDNLSEKRCGRKHPTNSCPSFTAECHKCGKKGHFKSKCRSKSCSDDANVAYTLFGPSRMYHVKYEDRSRLARYQVGAAPMVSFRYLEEAFGCPSSTSKASFISLAMSIEGRLVSNLYFVTYLPDHLDLIYCDFKMEETHIAEFVEVAFETENSKVLKKFILVKVKL